MQTPQYSAEDEQTLMASLWTPALKDDPLKFVMYLFPWGQKNTPLENFSGPRKWQREVLRDIGAHIKQNNGKIDFDVLRMAVSSGRGIGKSALVSWLVIWMLSTRIGSTTIVSANSETQLRSVTWAEITKWLALSLNSHWFEVSATRVMPAKWLTELVERDLKKGTRYWGVEGRLWSEENPDAYAGVHNFDGVMLIFDEASGISDAIWAVAAGFFTENTPHRFWMAFSNPRRNTGYFYEAFNAKRDFWRNKVVDARSVEGTDKAVYEQIIQEYGPDSVQAHVEVYGEFPSAGDDQFIPVYLVDDATQRPRYKDATAPIIIGVDPARFGADATVIAVRQGRDLNVIKRYRGRRHHGDRRSRDRGHRGVQPDAGRHRRRGLGRRHRGPAQGAALPPSQGRQLRQQVHQAHHVRQQARRDVGQHARVAQDGVGPDGQAAQVRPDVAQGQARQQGHDLPGGQEGDEGAGARLA